MMFHVGTLRRLNDGDMLPRLAAISGVSGGPLASAYRADRWPDLSCDDGDRASHFDEVIEQPLRELAGTTLDVPSVLSGLLPFTSAAQRQVAKFDERLFHGAFWPTSRPVAPPAPARGRGRCSSSTRAAC